MHECPVCLDEKSKKHFKIIDCGHSVCFECYNKLLSFKHHHCPICRYNFKSDVENIFYKTRKRRRNLTIQEYRDRRIKIKDRYNLRKKKKDTRFYKLTGNINQY